MNVNTYQKLALRTDTGGDRELRLRHACYGVCTESGELIDVYKRHEFYGVEFDAVHALEELGDIMWYVAVGSDALQERLSSVMSLGCFTACGGDRHLYLAKKAGSLVDIYTSSRGKGRECGMKVAFGSIASSASMCAESIGSTLSDVMEMNIRKLRERYEGGFSQRETLTRDLQMERDVLRGASEFDG